MKILNSLRTISTVLFRRGSSENGDNHLKTQLTLRVMPWDLHLRVAHMDSYGFFMELGRWDQARKLGVIPLLVREQCAPFTLFQTMRFCKPLRLFQKFVVHTEIVYMDREYTYIRHKIYRGQTLICYGLIKYLISGVHGRVSTEKFYGVHAKFFDGRTPPAYIQHSAESVNQLFEGITESVGPKFPQ